MTSLLAGPTTAASQAVRGVVIDDSSGRAVAGAQVRLVSGGELGESDMTDQSGRFFLAVPDPGEYQLEVSGLGYATARSQTLEVLGADTLSVEFYIAPDAVLLSPITVTARTRVGSRHFERRRMEWGRGVYMDPSHLMVLEPDHPAEVLEDVEDVLVRWDWGRNYDGSLRMLPSVRTFRGRGCLMYMIDFVPVRGPSGGGGWTGYQLTTIDGRDIVAVEVYRSALEVPPELRKYSHDPYGTAANCGLVLFWTRLGWHGMGF